MLGQIKISLESRKRLVRHQFLPNLDLFFTEEQPGVAWYEDNLGIVPWLMPICEYCNCTPCYCNIILADAIQLASFIELLEIE